VNKTKLNCTELNFWYLRRQMAAKTSLTKYIVFLLGYVQTNPIFFKPHTVLNESAFRPHETSEFGHQNRAHFFETARHSGSRPRPHESGQKICGSKNVRIRVDKALYIIPIRKTPQHLTERLT